jgi:DNA-damage-inducible protein J
MKTATVQARIEPKLKKEVEAILAKIGLSASEAISMYYSSIKLHKGIPFEAKVPNKALRKAMRDVELGRNLHRVKNPDNLIEEILAQK